MRHPTTEPPSRVDYVANGLVFLHNLRVCRRFANNVFSCFVANLFWAILFTSFSSHATAGYSEQTWQVADGLPSAQVRAITQSRDGYLWLGTLEGLARFDGTTFTTVERRTFRDMKGQLYIGLAESQDGSIWFSNGQGLSRHLGDKTMFYGVTNGLPSEYVMTVFVDRRGEIIVGTDKGVRKFENEEFVPLVAEDPISNAPVRVIVEEKSGTILLGTGKGLFKFADGKITTFGKEGDQLKDNPVFSLAIGKNGRLWLGTSMGITRIDDSITHFGIKDGLQTNVVRALFCDKAGTLWVGTQIGLQCLEQEQLPFVNQSNSTGDTQQHELIYTIFEDEEHNIWIGTNRGLRRLKAERFRAFSLKEGLPNKAVYSVYEDRRGTVWLGTATGIARIKNDVVLPSLAFTNETSTYHFPRIPVLSVLEDEDGDMWFGTQNGIYRMRDEDLLHYTAEKSKLADNTVRCMLQFNSKTFFFGNNNGLTRYRFQLFTNYASKVGLRFTDVKALAHGKEGKMWVGSEEGLTVFRGDTYKRYTMKDGLSSEWVNALYVDKEETLWIGTENGGLDRFKNGRFVAITPAAAGIFSERIYSIIEDDNGNLWMGSRHGIFHAEKKELDDFADGKISSVHCVSYGQPDGLRNTQCSGVSQPAAWKGRDGRLWFATIDGVAMIDSRKITINTVPPKLIVQKVIVDGQSMNLRQRMRFAPGKGNFQFEYTAICLQAPEKVRFKYMLKGVDADWIDAGTRRVASYANLAPGTYEFLLRACNNDGVWTETPASFAYTLAPHFYQTTVFYIGCISALAFGALGFHMTRVRSMAARETELRELVAKRTAHLEEALKSMETFTYSMAHDLRSPLRAIRGLTQVLFEDYRQHFDATAINYSQRIERSVEKMDALIADLLVYGQLAHSKVPVKTVNLENILEKVRLELEPQIRARKAAIETKGPLPEVIGNDVLLQQVLINLVSNGIKFVAPDTEPRLQIWAEREGDKVRIFVRDNGIGIKPEHHQRIFNLFERLHGENVYQGTGVGLAIVQKAIERMGGKVGVTSQYGKGSCFWIELPGAF